MKKNLKAVFSIMLALVMALAALPVSALPRFEADEAIAEKAAIEPCWTVPEGYNVHDYTKCVEFLEQTDENGIKNGEKLSESYDPNDPGTWGDVFGEDCFQWTTVNGENKLRFVFVWNCDLFGSMDLSDCSALFEFVCQYTTIAGINLSDCVMLNSIDCQVNECLAELNVSGCANLNSLICSGNILADLEISSCTALVSLNCESNSLTELNVSNNQSLRFLYCAINSLVDIDLSNNHSLMILDCRGNGLSELDLSQNTDISELNCASNNLSQLDLSNNVSLGYLECRENNLSVLDISHNPELYYLSCENNNLSLLDLSANPLLAYDVVRAEGNGYIGYCYGHHDSGSYFYELYAYPFAGADFVGFFDEDGVLLSDGNDYGEWYDGYVYDFYEYYGATYSGTVIARFSGGALPGDIDGSGSVSTADAIMTLRLAMQLSDGGGMNLDAADMDGSGTITLADAILILRTAMGLA